MVPSVDHSDWRYYGTCESIFPAGKASIEAEGTSSIRGGRRDLWQLDVPST